jgi:hypothetical protein
MRNDRWQGTLRRGVLGAALVVTLGAAPFVGRLARAHAAPADTNETPATTRKDQVDLSVTVYNSNLALIRDVRQVTLPSATFSLRFEDVAAAVNPATVHFRSLSEPNRLSVLEQNYEYDLLDPQKLLQKYVGREVTLVRPMQGGGTTNYAEVKALLLADNNGPVWKVGNEIVTGMYAESYRFPELPENLYSRPTLLWMLSNKGSRSQRVEASYLTGSMNWNADYVLTVGRDEKTADLDGWVTLANNSGVAYRDARLQLVAGQVHHAASIGGIAMESIAAKAAPAPPPFAQENFSEYHLYTLDRRTSIENNESKQINLLSGTGFPVEKAFIVQGEPYFYRGPQQAGQPLKQAVRVYYRFKNEEKPGLGMPLPAGTVRVYQADSKGSLQFVGEDAIDHTPKNEQVKLYVGDAFDIVCERKQTDYRKLSDRLSESEFEITIRNHKETPITVEVVEPVGGDWQVLSSSHKWTKLDAFSLGFTVPVAANATSILSYRVRVHW